METAAVCARRPFAYRPRFGAGLPVLRNSGKKESGFSLNRSTSDFSVSGAAGFPLRIHTGTGFSSGFSQ